MIGSYETDDRDYDLIIAVMDGRDQADEFSDAVKDRESQGAFNVKEAATFARDEQGKIKLNNKGYVAG